MLPSHQLQCRGPNKKHMDNLVVRLGSQICLHVGMQAAPFPMFRIAPMLGPHIYSRVLVSIHVLNFAMVGVSYWLLGGVEHMPGTFAWAILSGLTLVVAIASGTLTSELQLGTEPHCHHHNTAVSAHRSVLRWYRNRINK